MLCKSGSQKKFFEYRPLPHPPTKRGKCYRIIFANDCVQATTVRNVCTKFLENFHKSQVLKKLLKICSVDQDRCSIHVPHLVLVN